MQPLFRSWITPTYFAELVRVSSLSHREFWLVLRTESLVRCIEIDEEGANERKGYLEIAKKENLFKVYYTDTTYTEQRFKDACNYWFFGNDGTGRDDLEMFAEYCRMGNILSQEFNNEAEAEAFAEERKKVYGENHVAILHQTEPPPIGTFTERAIRLAEKDSLS